MSRLNPSFKIKSGLASFSAILIISLWLAGMFLPESRLWGINHLSYFPVLWGIVFTGFVLAVIIISSSGFCDSCFEKAPEYLARLFSRVHKAILIPLISIFCLLIFYYFSDAVNILGDGVLRIAELDKFRGIPATEPLDFLIHHFSLKYIFLPLGLSVEACFQIWSYIAGIIYVWGAWLFSGKLAGFGYPRARSFIYFLGFGGILMFFGYAENYGFAVAVLMLFFNSAAGYLGGRQNPGAVTGLYLLAFFMHNSVIFLLPAVIYLLARQAKAGRRKAIAGLLATGIVISAWMIYSYGSRQSGAFLLPDSPTEPGYLLWSGRHLMDIINELFLISPAFLVLLWLQAGTEDIKLKHLRIFFRLGGLSGLIAAVLIDPKLGMARDWDLFGLLLLALHAALFIGVDWRKQIKIIGNSAVVITAAFTCVWVFLNSDDVRAINRYKNIIELDEARSRYGYEVLSYYYTNNKQYHQAEWACYRSIQKYPHYRSYNLLGTIQIRMKKLTEAEINFKKALELHPGDVEAIKNLGQLYYSLGRLREAGYYLDLYRQTPKGFADPAINNIYSDIRHRLAEQGEE